MFWLYFIGTFIISFYPHLSVAADEFSVILADQIPNGNATTSSTFVTSTSQTSWSEESTTAFSTSSDEELTTPSDTSIPPSTSNTITSSSTNEHHTTTSQSTDSATSTASTSSTDSTSTSSSKQTSSPSKSPTLPSAAPDEGSNESSGISKKDKNIAIGVGIGIGIPVMISACGLIWWFVKGRNNDHVYDNDFIDNNNKFDGSDINSNDVFRANLDQYHQPSNNINSAANF